MALNSKKFSRFSKKKLFLFLILLSLNFYFSGVTSSRYFMTKLYSENDLNLHFDLNLENKKNVDFDSHMHLKVKNRKIINIPCKQLQNPCNNLKSVNEEISENQEVGENSIEHLLRALLKFVLCTDRVLLSLLLPPTPFNSSLSHTLRYVSTVIQIRTFHDSFFSH